MKIRVRNNGTRKVVITAVVMLAGFFVYNKVTADDGVSAQASMGRNAAVVNTVDASNAASNTTDTTVTEVSGITEESINEGAEENALKASVKTGRVYEFKSKKVEDSKVEINSKLAIAATEEGVVAINDDENGERKVYLDKDLGFNMCASENLNNVYMLRDVEDVIVGVAEFNDTNTKGSIVDIDGNIVARYYADVNMVDFTVIIYDNNICSDMTILMIMTDYVSGCQNTTETTE